MAVESPVQTPVSVPYYLAVGTGYYSESVSVLGF